MVLDFESSQSNSGNGSGNDERSGSNGGSHGESSCGGPLARGIPGGGSECICSGLCLGRLSSIRSSWQWVDVAAARVQAATLFLRGSIYKSKPQSKLRVSGRSKNIMFCFLLANISPTQPSPHQSRVNPFDVSEGSSDRAPGQYVRFCWRAFRGIGELGMHRECSGACLTLP